MLFFKVFVVVFQSFRCCFSKFSLLFFKVFLVFFFKVFLVLNKLNFVSSKLLVGTNCNTSFFSD